MKGYIKAFRLGLFSITIFVLFSCKSAQISKSLSKSLKANFYDHQFTGFMVYNPRTKDTVFNYNGDRYFTPASNTKIFTLFTALQFLPEYIPAFTYAVAEDTIVMRGTGDPTFLHPYFNDSTALKFINNYKEAQLLINNFKNEKFGPGWAWEDYDRYFSPERSSFPMYGNVVTIAHDNNLVVIPDVLRSRTYLTQSNTQRDYNTNVFYYKSGTKNKIEIPMVMDSMLIDELWKDLIPNKIKLIHKTSRILDQIAYSVPSDSLYKRMMHLSDNFLAEQMLVLSSSMISDTLDVDRVRDSIINHHLKDLKHKPRWVDGSGLSRYNLFTPASFVQVLSKLYTEIPTERLFNFFPSGGVSGTLKNWYTGEARPYIYAKSGTVGNNYSLSGYLLTNSGELLIFSFMNNHYTKPTSEVKARMQSIFEWLRDHY
ncbi:D-alanyl-D-alanine carboxypeptidase/D-alanyl-D-alanine-endopeptidase [Geojedonia litorea]|uniref:D-alanyl-D-alanine carboxypeptidase/D-alanyl-D-alanine-endopeptidase n=1 Tax=Geojedonia litorea TaxID=1268269 RepID=A0ABV9N7U0_9FLAO